jgi:predicted MFS family arabinose efflux permease
MAINTTTPPAMSRQSGALALYAFTVAAFFAASSAPTPLYSLYQHAWGFTPAMLTVVFSVYAFSLLAALLTTGSLSDHLGRHRVITGSIALEVLAMLIFVYAHNVQTLIVARVLQGFATGTATSALGAAILDTSRTRGPLVNALSPLVGMALGALGSALLVRYAPSPMRLVYSVLIAIFVLQAGYLRLIPETVSRAPGALASLMPRVRVPVAARGAMLRIAPVNIAVWALGGFYLSLGPTLARAVTGSSDITLGGWVVFALTSSGLVAILLLRSLSTLHLVMAGASALALGLVVTLLGVHGQSPIVFFLGTSVAGVGFGAAFQGGLRSVLPLAAAHERAGLMAAFYVLSYLAFSIPAIIAGTMTHVIGLRPTTDVYGIALIVLATSTLLASAFTQGTLKRT